MEKLQQDIIKFVEERGWTGNKDPRNLAISISLEASELLEHFQWNPSEETMTQNKEEIADEAADIFIYLLQFADVLGIDLKEVASQKMKRNATRFPVV